MDFENPEGKPRFNPLASLRSFIASSRRVFIIAKKPDSREFQAMIKATAIGIIVIGAIGYIIYLVFVLAGIH
ncbi:MAG: protein translocase SEC61 complex subunit gamma [Candidatus Diapherotrites archaeon]|nr:protein translocase SEC61 complex subunit gamma [Candidatus Diapherotrites archaeon]